MAESILEYLKLHEVSEPEILSEESPQSSCGDYACMVSTVQLLSFKSKSNEASLRNEIACGSYMRSQLLQVGTEYDKDITSISLGACLGDNHVFTRTQTRLLALVPWWPLQDEQTP